MRKLIPYVVALALGFGAGMYVGSDFQYKVEREKNQPFLYNRKTHEKQLITSDFQLGTLEYRVEGIKKEIRQMSRPKEIQGVVNNADGSH